MKRNMVGNYLEENVIFNAVAISGTTPIVAVTPCNLDCMDGMSLVLVTSGTVAGAWTMEASNNYVQSMRSTDLNQVVASGNWASCTALFLPAVTAAAGSPTSQYTQTAVAFMGRFVCLTFTPTSGAGTVSAFYCAKGVG